MTMPFGRHKGLELTELPLDYLEWLAGRHLHGWLRAAVDQEVKRRQFNAAAEGKEEKEKTESDIDNGVPW